MKTGNQIFLEKFNRAFANNDTNYILEQVTDDIQWEIVGDKILKGEKTFAEALKEMEQTDPLELAIHHIIPHGKHASVNGKMKSPDGNIYAFCDIYRLNGFKNPKINEMISYAIELNH